jgi:shikimate dehydrogenase
VSAGAPARLAAVLGWPVAHSRSPALHNAAYRALDIDAVYVALAVAPGELAAALGGVRALGFLGVNVTVPHKEEARRLCDEVDRLAAEVGAVNTIVVRDGRLVGANTDVAGFARALADEGGASGPVVILGAGGSARAVAAAVRADGGEPRVVARRPEKARELGAGFPWTPRGLGEALDGAGLVVDTTPTGLSHDSDSDGAHPVPVPLERLDQTALVASLVYHREPALLSRARALGLRTMDGAGMLVHQAALAFTLMTGREAPLDVMRAAFAQPTAR